MGTNKRYKTLDEANYNYVDEVERKPITDVPKRVGRYKNFLFEKKLLLKSKRSLTLYIYNVYVSHGCIESELR